MDTVQTLSDDRRDISELAGDEEEEGTRGEDIRKLRGLIQEQRQEYQDMLQGQNFEYKGFESSGDLSCAQGCFVRWPQPRHAMTLLTDIIQDFSVEAVAIVLEQHTTLVDKFARMIFAGITAQFSMLEFDGRVLSPL